MPCTDGGPSHEQVMSERAVPACMCAVIRKHGIKIVIESLDESAHDEPAELARWITNWWSMHQHEDDRRAVRERRSKADEALREQARSKLTPEERKALGL